MTKSLVIEIGKSYRNEIGEIITLTGSVPRHKWEQELFIGGDGCPYTFNGIPSRSTFTGDNVAEYRLVMEETDPVAVKQYQALCASSFLLGKETFDKWRQWGEETFGQATPLSIVKRTKKEFEELEAEVDDRSAWSPQAIEEAADVVLILTRVPGLWDAIVKKQALNEHNRTWICSGNGTGLHEDDQRV